MLQEEEPIQLRTPGSYKSVQYKSVEPRSVIFNSAPLKTPADLEVFARDVGELIDKLEPWYNFGVGRWIFHTPLTTQQVVSHKVFSWETYKRSAHALCVALGRALQDGGFLLEAVASGDDLWFSPIGSKAPKNVVIHARGVAYLK